MHFQEEYTQVLGAEDLTLSYSYYGTISVVRVDRMESDFSITEVEVQLSGFPIRTFAHIDLLSILKVWPLEAHIQLPKYPELEL